jgi:hypothetical protein
MLRYAGRLAPVVVVLTLAVSPVGASGPEAAAPRVVPSPYSVLDPCDASVDTTDDISYVQVRNGPTLVDLRWATRTCTRPQTLTDAGRVPDSFVRFQLIEPNTEPGVEYRVFVYPADTGGGYQVEVQHRDGTRTCLNRNYRELGPTFVGTLHSARFRFDCIGGRQPFRIRLWSYSGDEVPNRRYTPVVTPA